MIVTSSTLLPAGEDHRIAIIVNGSNLQNISALDIKNIYTDRVITWNNGNKIDVYNLPVAAPAREVFSRHILGLNAQDADIMESNRDIINTNRNRNPHIIKRDQLIPYIVEKNPNAIAYVRAGSLEDRANIRIIMYLPTE
ncbi:MAG: hypothetical protein HY940_07530 [Gammaproteobacteria bacterium]|nr:hypothetical protein [Gammaproteobacteria bacterium]